MLPAALATAAVALAAASLATTALSPAAVTAAALAAAALAAAAIAAVALAAATVAQPAATVAQRPTHALTRMPGVQSSKPKLHRGELLPENHFGGWNFFKPMVRTTYEYNLSFRRRSQRRASVLEGFCGDCLHGRAHLPPRLVLPQGRREGLCLC